MTLGVSDLVSKPRGLGSHMSTTHIFLSPFPALTRCRTSSRLFTITLQPKPVGIHAGLQILLILSAVSTRMRAIPILPRRVRAHIEGGDRSTAGDVSELVDLGIMNGENSLSDYWSFVFLGYL